MCLLAYGSDLYPVKAKFSVEIRYPSPAKNNPPVPPLSTRDCQKPHVEICSVSVNATVCFPFFLFSLFCCFSDFAASVKQSNRTATENTRMTALLSTVRYASPHTVLLFSRPMYMCVGRLDYHFFIDRGSQLMHQ